MKTPMQELLEWVRATFPMDLDTPRMIEDKIQSLLDKEKEIIEEAFSDGLTHYPNDSDPRYVRDYYNETFNTKEKRSDNFEKERYPTLHWDSLPTPNEINKRNTKE